jgi:hypothetical protein
MYTKKEKFSLLALSEKSSTDSAGLLSKFKQMSAASSLLSGII